ncbi:helix-turn-helix domain-containing protein [Aeromonas salmonicida]|uniref:helix-turn-helix domain-containing protein n=1 Tax=Aeromonas salmonicida TaxID=645 RepID=UPI000A1160DE|nr:helix-turn-helix transcriptional regulator [Aeromonas salmonicida]ORJ12001.1 transcriptional regulator [Aeromonas salmonicida]ORJ17026.1 transcriptional regulator [Aeromonas salmonicida]WCH33659.1 helix-turn-helix domain-containing protein [Aeromonas salmonicida]WCH37869.1 helix-turn-helix domain-containing protein [Aeromonas salmonicida]WGI41154.1 helix-turn-helix transcriptional regulator [Aeromonas salmonicida]
MPNANLPSISYLNHHARRRLRQLREALQLSRPKFAEKLGIPQTTLKNYELGYREIGGGLLLVIANHNELNEHTSWLMTGTNPSPLLVTAADIRQCHQ